MQRHFKKGEWIFRQGDVANRFYLIQNGKVALEASVNSNEHVLLQTVGPGETLGLSWMFSHCYWRVQARALEPTHTVFFVGTRLLAQCDQDHSLGYQIFKRIAAAMMERVQAARQKFLECHRRSQNQGLASQQPRP
jgi:CRP-like cAMP-binding protein